MSNTENRGENELRCSECGGIIQKNELALGSIWEIPGGLEKLRNKMNSTLREELVSVALKWQERYGIAPQITTPLSEYDAAMLVGFPEHEYSCYMQPKTAVDKGLDFVYRGVRYHIQGCRDCFLGVIHIRQLVDTLVRNIDYYLAHLRAVVT